jgi:hypothetical protein
MSFNMDNAPPLHGYYLWWTSSMGLLVVGAPRSHGEPEVTAKKFDLGVLAHISLREDMVGVDA